MNLKPLIPLFVLCSLVACSTELYGPGEGFGPEGGVDAGSQDPDDPQDNPDPDSSNPDDPDAGSQSLQVSVMPTELSLSVGDTATAQAQVRDGKDDVAATITWASSDTSIATVDSTGLITAMSDGLVEISASVDTDSAVLSLSVDAIDCPAGEGNNGDSCADIYQGQDIWRCTVSPALDGATVSQVCRDSGNGAEWVTFHINPTECCDCAGDFSVGCCAANSGSTGCP